MRRTSRAVLVSVQAGLAALAIGGWEYGARAGWIDPFFFSQPSAFLARVGEWLTDPAATALGGKSVYRHLAVTLEEAAASFASGVGAGVAAGFLLGRSDFWARVLRPYIQVANALPRLVLAPIFVLVLGIDRASKIALGFSLVFFIAFFNAYHGVRDVDRDLVRNARMLGARGGGLARHVLFPSAMSWIVSSLHTSVGFALVGAVVGEYVASAQGLGWVIGQAQGNFDAAGVFAGLVLLCAVVVIVELGVTRLERRLLRWKAPASDDLLAA